jgi:drug/metabolite transporter (DMT)-like permease
VKAISGKDEPKDSVATVAQLIFGMALFGSATPLSKIIGEAFSVFTASFSRMAIASAVLGPAVWFFTKRFSRMERSDLIVIAAIAAVGMVGFTATMLFGMRLTTGVIGSTIMSSTPAVTALAAVIFLGAAINWRKAGALSLAVAGCVLINLFRNSSKDNGEAVLLGSLLVAIAVCFEAAFTLLSRRLSEGITSIEATFAASLLAMPFFAVLAFIFDAHPFSFAQATKSDWAALIFWGAATGGLAPVLWYRGVRSAPPALTAASMGVMPLTALTLSYILLGEDFQVIHLLGFGLVFAGLVLMIFEHAIKTEASCPSMN